MSPRARKPASKARRKNQQRSLEKRQAIIEGALRVFGERGFDEATISAICKAAGVSDATLYEYFTSKEQVLFSIAEHYTRRELERMQALTPYIRTPREKLRVIIQGYLEFYQANPLYTSVALLTLKGNRRFVESPSYQVVREASRTIVEAFMQGVEEGHFRDDLDPYIVRNMLLGFIEHLTIQWLLTGRPETIAGHTDAIFDLVMRAIRKEPSREWTELRVRVEGASIMKGPGPAGR